MPVVFSFFTQKMRQFLIIFISLPALAVLAVNSTAEHKEEVSRLEQQISSDFHIPLPHLLDSLGVFRKFKCALCKDIDMDKWTFIAGEISVNAPFITDWCRIAFRIFQLDWLGKEVCNGFFQKSVDKFVHHLLETKEKKAQWFCSLIFLCPRHPKDENTTTPQPSTTRNPYPWMPPPL